VQRYGKRVNYAQKTAKKNTTTLAGSDITSLCLTKNPFQFNNVSGFSFSFDPLLSGKTSRRVATKINQKIESLNGSFTATTCYPTVENFLLPITKNLKL
jgi:hypothetical protein